MLMKDLLSNDGPYPLPEVTEFEICLFLTIIQIGHNICNSLKGCWPAVELLFLPSYGQTVRCDRFVHIVIFLQFSDSDSALISSDRLWKLRHIFDLLIVSYSEYYALSEYLGADEVLMLFKGRIILKLHTQGTHSFGIKLHESCDICGCTYDTGIYMVFIVQAYQSS
jgi:hypothetical protein